MTPEEQKRKEIEDLLLAKFSSAQDTSDIDAEKEKAKKSQIVTGIGAALEGMARAGSVSRGGRSTDENFYQGLSDKAQQSVQNAISERQRKIQDIIQGNALQKEMDSEDRLNSAQKATESNLKSEAEHRSKQENLNQEKADEDKRHNLVSEDNLKVSKENSLSNKTKEDQNKAESELRNHLETFRGNQVAKQAAMDTYSAAKALEIVKNRDPNTLTTQDLSLLATEMNKIASGGVPTENGIKHLMPSNLNTKAAELRNFLSSKPSDAEAGEYIKRNMDYLKGMVSESKKVISEFHSNIAKGYKNRVTPEALKSVQTDYSLDENLNPVQESNFPKKVMNSKTGQSATVSNEQELKEANSEGFQ